MKLYNSYSTKKEEINEKIYKIYNCGPTVYNYVHIGNIRPLITFDILYRFLLSQNKKVEYVLNITDVDDKIIDKAIKEKKTEKEISTKYAKAYFDLFKKLNVLNQSYNPLVSENIKGIEEYIDKLINNGSAYLTKEGDAYFDIGKFKNEYGKLSKQNIANLLEGVRKENSNDKHNPLDFVLWKKTNIGINWKTKFNNHGRPGWHTECAYFINKYFGNNGVTIHGGGIDLKFPHHENELIQNLALTKKPMAKIWMHVGHINVDNEKMSKSLNNFILAKDILKKYDGNIIRWFFLQTQYENPINFSDNLLIQAKNEINKVYKSINYAIIWLEISNVKYEYTKNKLSFEFIDFMNDDLNFPNVISHIYEINKKISQLLKNKLFKLVVLNLNILISELKVLGFTYKFNEKYFKNAKLWKQALEKKDFVAADKIRDELMKEEII